MSSSSQDDATEQVQHLAVRMHIWVALVAVYLYDYVLCIPREIEFIWFGRFRAATVFYFGARYLPFAKLIFQLIVAASPRNPPHCTAWYQFVELLGVFGRAAIIGTLLGRTYAVFTFRKVIILLPAALGAVAVILGGYEVFQTYCVSGPARFDGSSKWGLIIAATRLVMEATVICLLIFQSHIDFRLQGAVHHMTRQTFASFIFRSGVLYFLTAFCVESLAIIFNGAWSWAPDELRGTMSALPLPIPAILISRFLLELREMAASDVKSPQNTMNTSSSDFVGSFSTIHAHFVHDFDRDIDIRARTRRGYGRNQDSEVGMSTMREDDAYLLREPHSRSGSGVDDIESYEMTRSPRSSPDAYTSYVSSDGRESGSSGGLIHTISTSYGPR